MANCCSCSNDKIPKGDSVEPLYNRQNTEESFVTTTHNKKKYKGEVKISIIGEPSVGKMTICKEIMGYFDKSHGVQDTDEIEPKQS